MILTVTEQEQVALLVAIYSASQGCEDTAAWARTKKRLAVILNGFHSDSSTRSDAISTLLWEMFAAAADNASLI